MGRVAIYAYGSLLHDPGTALAERIMEKSALESPWPIEYARSSVGRWGAPTLTLHASGACVSGALLVLKEGVAEPEARQCLWEREGKPLRTAIKTTSLPGYACVLYCQIEPNIDPLTAEELARLAIESVPRAGSRNGIRYLADCMRVGIITPLTNAYEAAILRMTSAPTLDDAERRLCKG